MLLTLRDKYSPLSGIKTRALLTCIKVKIKGSSLDIFMSRKICVVRVTETLIFCKNVCMVHQAFCENKLQQT